MYTIEELLSLVNKRIANLNYPSQPIGLYEPIKYVLSLGGKRIRPVMTLLSYNLFKEDVEKALPIALALEIYHNYTLLHDDLMDKADIRRGKITVHKKWNDNTAILSGDSMLVLAYNCLLNHTIENSLDISRIFTKTALEIGEGQQYDMNFETRDDVTQDEYIEMIRLKTSVLLACAMKCGALVADASSKDADLLYNFGEQLGLAFQIQDDFLDVYGSVEIFGKKIGGDILCNKKTYLYINAYQRADAKKRKILDHWFSMIDCDQQEKIEAVTAIYSELGIDILCKDTVESYYKKALMFLDQVQITDQKKENLTIFAKKLLSRNY